MHRIKCASWTCSNILFFSCMALRNSERRAYIARTWRLFMTATSWLKVLRGSSWRSIISLSLICSRILSQIEINLNIKDTENLAKLLSRIKASTSLSAFFGLKRHKFIILIISRKIINIEAKKLIPTLSAKLKAPESVQSELSSVWGQPIATPPT